MANRQIKFIWDFFGEDAEQTAIHHGKHLETFFALNKIEFTEIGTAVLSDLKCMAFVVSAEANVPIIKNSLRPHRATIEE